MARTLYGLVLLLAIWLAVLFLFTINLGPISFPRSIQFLRPGSEPSHGDAAASIGASPDRQLGLSVGVWIWATLIFFSSAVFAVQGADALCDAANLGGVAPWI